VKTVDDRLKELNIKYFEKAFLFENRLVVELCKKYKNHFPFSRNVHFKALFCFFRETIFDCMIIFFFIIYFFKNLFLFNLKKITFSIFFSNYFVYFYPSKNITTEIFFKKIFFFNCIKPD
jgi:hypothetical protein